MGIVERAQPICSYSVMKRYLIASLWLERGPCNHSRFIRTVSSGAVSVQPFIPSYMMNWQLNPKLYSCWLDWSCVCLSCSAATGGKKNCSSGETSLSCRRWETSSQAQKEKYIFHRAWSEDMKRKRMRWREWKLALWDSSVKLTRRDDRASPQSQTVSYKLLVNYGVCPVHHSVCATNMYVHTETCVPVVRVDLC